MKPEGDACGLFPVLDTLPQAYKACTNQSKRILHKRKQRLDLLGRVLSALR
jgi:hypothetical protein